MTEEQFVSEVIDRLSESFRVKYASETDDGYPYLVLSERATGEQFSLIIHRES